MKKIVFTLGWKPWLGIILILISKAALAASDSPTDIKAMTNADAAVPVEVLAHRVKPLTICELQAEAQAWLLLLQEKVSEISNAEVAAFYKKEEIEKTEEVEDALEDVQEAEEDADCEEVKETTQEAQEALKEAREVENKIMQDTAVREAIEAAKSKSEAEGGTVAATDKTLSTVAHLILAV